MSKRALVRKQIATVALGCSECDSGILPGERYATYMDRVVYGPSVKRTYCQGCTLLLEDSLTTTEEV